MNELDRADMRSIQQREWDRLYAIKMAAQALIDDVRRRYPGEEFKCPYMRELDARLKNS